MEAGCEVVSFACLRANIELTVCLLPRDLDHNEISGTIEDTSGAFGGLDSLSKL